MLCIVGFSKSLWIFFNFSNVTFIFHLFISLQCIATQNICFRYYRKVSVSKFSCFFHFVFLLLSYHKIKMSNWMEKVEIISTFIRMEKKVFFSSQKLFLFSCPWWKILSKWKVTFTALPSILLIMLPLHYTFLFLNVVFLHQESVVGVFPLLQLKLSSESADFSYVRLHFPFYGVFSTSFVPPFSSFFFFYFFFISLFFFSVLVSNYFLR